LKKRNRLGGKIQHLAHPSPSLLTMLRMLRFSRVCLRWEGLAMKIKVLLTHAVQCIPGEKLVMRTGMSYQSCASAGAKARRYGRPTRPRSDRRRRWRRSARSCAFPARAPPARTPRKSGRGAPGRSSFIPGASMANSSWPKYRLRCAAGDDRAVVGNDRALPHRVQVDLACAQVDIHHLAERHARLLLPAQHISDRRGDVPWGKQTGRDLVEEGLDQ
jgi:hypothetical protein